jgi:hypothetical protein
MTSDPRDPGDGPVVVADAAADATTAPVSTGWALLILTVNLASAAVFAGCAAAMWWASTVESHGEDGLDLLPDVYFTLFFGSLIGWLAGLMCLPLLPTPQRRLVVRIAGVVVVLFLLLPVPND